MLRFFRKMRQVLVPENRLGRYFFYSAGEIILVVIGILIALGIDNWNENKSRHASAQQQLKTLGQNIEEDMEQLRDLSASMDTIILYSKTVLDQIKTLRSMDENTQQAILFLTFEYNLYPNKSGLEMMNNNGLMSYLEEDIQIMILKYYTLLDQIKSREEISNSFIKTKYETYMIDRYNKLFNKTNPLGMLHDNYKDDPRHPDLVNEETLRSDKKLEVLIFARLYQTRKQKVLYEETLELARHLKTHILSK